MRPKLMLILLVAAAALGGLLIVQSQRRAVVAASQQADTESRAHAADNSPQLGAQSQSTAATGTRRATDRPATQAAPSAEISSTDKLERLSEIRAKFQKLAAGEPTIAMEAAKQIQDETERETALLTLVTQWTHGELRSPHERAQAIETYGLEAGLGIELASNPELALTWANELTQGFGRQGLLTQTAITMAGSDPAAAFALAQQLPEEQQRQFFDSVFAGWAAKDTEAALQWADQISDPAEHDAAVQAIRTAAPVGIGTALTVQDGYAVVHQLLPGTPAELSGQLHLGDRILALAQGDNSFMDVHGVPLAQLVEMIRGAPGSTLQLQVLSADAPADSAPRTISIVRDQIKFKR